MLDSGKGNSSKKKPDKNDFVLDRDMVFPRVGGERTESNAVSYTLGGQLKRKITMLKEKFESDITDL